MICNKLLRKNVFTGFLILIVVAAGIIAGINIFGDEEEPGPEVLILEAFPEIFPERSNMGILSYLDSPDDGTNRIFVSQLEGRILVFENRADVSEYDIYLDLSDNIRLNAETGLYSFAFHPDFEKNGYFYVSYVNNKSQTIVSRYSTSETDPNRADVNSELIILLLDQPSPYHNGGQILFGSDNYLYISLGDGGYSTTFEIDVGGAQDQSTLFGSILRIDVDNLNSGLNYSIPPDNPYYNNEEGYREEILAYGFRNPWKMSYDPMEGKLWIGEVGHEYFEEINVIDTQSIGGNFGWPIMEGYECYPISEEIEDCNQSDYLTPAAGYEHPGWTIGWSVTGGFVYRGENVPELYGKYVFADYVNRSIWTLESSSESNMRLLEWGFANVEQGSVVPLVNAISFGTDISNELYLLTDDGVIYQFQPV